MAVLKLSDGSMWVHSPVQLDDDLAAALEELGEVKHIVSPNYEHTKYAKQVRRGEVFDSELAISQSRAHAAGTIHATGVLVGEVKF